MKLLLDTCIIIDFFRNKEPAVEYISDLEAAPFISVITVTELLTGARNNREKEEVYSFADSCHVVEISLEISQQAGELLNQYYKSHGVGLGDGLIAATAQLHKLQLATNNLKHFPMFPELKRPY